MTEDERASLHNELTPKIARMLLEIHNRGDLVDLRIAVETVLASVIVMITRGQGEKRYQLAPQLLGGIIKDVGDRILEMENNGAP